MNIKKNISLYIGLAIPVLMILFVAGSIYLPRSFAPQPQHDFVYSIGDEFSYPTQYIVRGETVEKNTVEYPPEPKRPQTTPRLFRYDVTANQAEELSFEAATKLKLDSNAISSDGFEVTYGNQDTGIYPFFIFAERDYNSLYLTGHRTSNKINIPLPRNNYYAGWQFLGWVK